MPCVSLFFNADTTSIFLHPQLSIALFERRLLVRFNTVPQLHRHSQSDSPLGLLSISRMTTMRPYRFPVLSFIGAVMQMFYGLRTIETRKQFG